MRSSMRFSKNSMCIFRTVFMLLRSVIYYVRTCTDIITILQQFSFCNLSEGLSLCFTKQVQSTLVISNSKGLSELLRDIRTSHIRFVELRKK